MLSALMARLGSSPRVRGKLDRAAARGVGDGLIPARAGKTAQTPAIRSECRAHPRACGENSALPLRGRRVAGSSPRVRGKPPRRRRSAVNVGLIPARAGKTSLTPPETPSDTAHPRACGENDSRMVLGPSIRGSSPRVRGKRHRGSPHSVRSGLIPARAGKTQADRVCLFECQAHPRACGENHQHPL